MRKKSSIQNQTKFEDEEEKEERWQQEGGHDPSSSLFTLYQIRRPWQIAHSIWRTTDIDFSA